MQGIGDIEAVFYIMFEIITSIFLLLAANVPLSWFYMRQYMPLFQTDTV